ncbi:hypothetical protein IKG20_01765 [Candidatus Saccharibacteria bacterium]|nr:hypothetical protein [Candidatus Saccharibacteria bacterium]
MFLNRIGVNEVKKLSQVLSTDQFTAKRIADEYQLFSEPVDPALVEKVQDDFEESILEERRMAKVSLRAAVARAKLASSGYPAGRVERAVKEILKECAATMMSPSMLKHEIEKLNIAKKNGEKKYMKEKKTTELYGMEKVLGKAYTEIDENDFEKAIAGCPIKPTHDENDFLNNEPYIRSLFTYYPHVPTTLVVQYLFNKGCGSSVFGRIQKRIKELGIRQQVVKKEESLYEQAVFVGWAAGDAYASLKFVEEFNAKHPKKEKKSTTENTPAPKDDDKTTAPVNRSRQRGDISVRLTGDKALILRRLADLIEDGIEVDI